MILMDGEIHQLLTTTSKALVARECIDSNLQWPMGLLMGIHMGKGEILYSSQKYQPIKLNFLWIR